MSGFRIGRIAGIELHVHPTWFIILLLVIWVLAGVALPADFPELASPLRLAMAVAISLVFFMSLLVHELAHSLVALARGIPVHRITFFLFGGMAQTSRDSRTAGEEFQIAVAGPVASVALAALFVALWWYGLTRGWSPAVVGITGYVGALNLVLAVFNLLPGFPMDGGRILRAGIWAATGNVTSATRWAARVGSCVALLLVGYGIWRGLTGQLVAGVWLVLIGLFIRNAARSSYRQHLISRTYDVPRASAGRRQQPVLVGVAGGSGAGKSTVVRRVAESLPATGVAVISQDSYYRDLSHLPAPARADVNYDHPDALETGLLVQHLEALRAGRPAHVPVYDFYHHVRRSEAVRVEPAPVVIVDGILVLAHEGVRSLLDLKVFVDTPDQERLGRRMRRDVNRRGRSRDSILSQYETTVRPMHQAFVEPSRAHADIVLPRGGHDPAGIQQVVDRVREILERRRGHET